jgi:hypothetical protein
MVKRLFLLASLNVLTWIVPAHAETVSISPQFSPDPLSLPGASGGSVSVQAIAGKAETATGSCLGFAEQQPNQQLNLTAFFDSLSLVVDSSVDTTMVVKGPGGVWCNDDYQDKNAGISGQWLPGIYQVWVGNYNKQKVPYTLKISASQ